MSISCKDCRAFEALKRECRRKSPVMVPVPQKDALGQVAGFAAMGLYPATSAEGWCAEFIPAEVVS